MKTQFLIIFGIFFGFVSIANATLVVKNDTANQQAQQIQQYEEMTLEDARTIQILENDIRILDSEIKKCEKSKKGWIAGTVIGSVGVVATSAAAIAQGVKISKANETLSTLDEETTKLEKENKKSENQ